MGMGAFKIRVGQFWWRFGGSPHNISLSELVLFHVFWCLLTGGLILYLAVVAWEKVLTKSTCSRGNAPDHVVEDIWMLNMCIFIQWLIHISFVAHKNNNLTAIW